MGGRNSKNNDKSDRKAQRPKQESRRDQSSAAPFREGGASWGSGRGRNQKGVRERDWAKRDAHEWDDLQLSKRLGEGGERHKSGQESKDFGAGLEGVLLRALVLEVRKGNFLVQLLQQPVLPPGSPPLPKAIRTVPRGMLEHFDVGISSLVTTGDEVEVVLPQVNGQHGYEAVLARVHPRRNEFRRLHPSGRAVQTLAANVDQVAIVASSDEPPFRPGFVDRVLACAVSSGIPAMLVLNKIDLGVSEEVQELLDVYAKLNLPVIQVSALNANGLDALRAAIIGRRTVMCGHSGVGKSSLLAALLPANSEDVRVGEISSYTGKGQHTTTHARLFREDGLEVIDAPGVREFCPADTNKENLWSCFTEIAALQGQCQFSDCSHRHEKGCAVLAGVAAGTIHSRRHESFVRIFETLPG